MSKRLMPSATSRLRWYLLGAALFASSLHALTQEIDLPSSKALGIVPGGPQRLNSLPMSMAVSPGGRYVVTLNAGYGTFESGYQQSLAVLDTQTGTLADFPDVRTGSRAKQTLYSGLAFSGDGRHIYASMGSSTDPVGDGKAKAGSGVVVYGFSGGRIAPERMISIPLQPLAGLRRTRLIGGVDGAMGVPFPAAIAVLPPSPGTASERLLVADNLSDDVLLMDSATGEIFKRFDLSENNAVPSTYPVALALSKDGKRAFVALWNASEVVELNLAAGTVGRKLALLKPADPVKPGTHPCALAMSPDGQTLYAALSNRDAVAALDLGKGGFAIKGYFDARLPGQTFFGAEPETIAVSTDGRRLYVGNMGSDAVAVMDTARLGGKAAKQGMIEPVGFVPTEWMPMGLATVAGSSGERLYIATAKGKGTGPNNYPQKAVPGVTPTGPQRPFTYIGTLLYGSIAALDLKAIEADLPRYTEEVLTSNRMKAAEETIAFRGGQSPIKHVIYIIKENRTYDQVFGDLEQNGKRVGNGDKSLTMYGKDITPNPARDGPALRRLR